MTEGSEFAGSKHVMGIFEMLTSRDMSLIESFAADADTALEESREILQDMMPTIAYIDEPRHVMAGSMYFCAFMLAIFLPLRKREADVHEFGSQMLKVMREARQAEEAATSVPGAMARDALRSKDAKEDEFVFEVFEGEDDATDWGMNIKSCAICSLYSKYDAMDLVPYMCASDDDVSDVSRQGLRRSGSIALGAHQCDFRFKAGGEGHHLSAQYPDRIKIIE